MWNKKTFHVEVSNLAQKDATWPEKKGYTRTTITFEGILPQTPYLPLISGELWVLWLSADSKDR